MERIRLEDRNPMPFGPYAGVMMSKVPAVWLEQFASTAHEISDANDDVLEYIQRNRRRLDTILDAEEDCA